jgi:hypothetical protein
LLNDMSGDLKKHVEDSRKLANLKLYVQSRGQVVLTVVLGDTRQGFSSVRTSWK